MARQSASVYQSNLLVPNSTDGHHHYVVVELLWPDRGLSPSKYSLATLTLVPLETYSLRSSHEPATLAARAADCAKKDKTIITISHRLTTIAKADAVFMMKDGKLVEQGTAQELIAKKGEFYTMFESQIK